MADTPTPAPADPVIAAPAAPVDTTVVAPDASQAPAPSVVAAEAPAPVEPHPQEIPTLLETLVAPGKEPVVEAPSPEEPAAEPETAKEAEPPTEAAKEAAVEAPKPEPSAPVDYSKLKMPKNLVANDERMTEFTGLLDNPELAPVDRAQKLLDIAGDVMSQWATNYQKQALIDQISAFNGMRKKWQTSIMSDPELGGAGFETSKGVVARMRDKFISSAEYGSPTYDKHMNEFVEFLRVTGAGDHPAFYRFLHNVGRTFDEAAMPPPNPRPPPDAGRKPKGRISDLYASAK